MTMSILIFGTAIGLAESGPFESFFHKLKRAFAQPREKSHSHRTSHKQTGETPNSPNEIKTSAPAAGTQAPPSERNTRAATRAATKKGEDLRYGTPVPGKKGFVTSPFSPDSGYIDVRGFAPGTAVKDPYTGKIFLTP